MAQIMKNSTNKPEIRARGKFIRTSPTKVRRILDQIRGKSFLEASKILKFMPYKSSKLILNLLISASYNAKNNYNCSRKNLILKTAFVDKGPTLKRFRPRAQGRGFSIQKPTSHITILLESTEL